MERIIMQKLNVLFLMVIVMLVFGCASGQAPTGQMPIIDQDSKEFAAKIAGRRAGNELVKKYPDIAAEVLILCQEIELSDKPDVVNIAIRKIVVLLADETGDPLLGADINDLLDLLKIKPNVEIPPEQVAVVVAAAKGLMSGIEIGGRK
jgi:hypothetical protein